MEEAVKPMTLGEFIDALGNLPPCSSVRFDRFGLAPKLSFHSYRGDCGHLQMDYKDSGFVRAQQLRIAAIECVGKEFAGWKGGEYLMDVNTPLYVGRYGDCTRTMIVRVEGWGSPGYEGATIYTEQEE